MANSLDYWVYFSLSVLDRIERGLGLRALESTDV